MADEDARGRIIDEMSQTFNQGRGADGIIIARYVPDESLEGKNLEEIAESMGTTPAEAALRIYEKSEAMVVSYGMTEEDVETFAAHPLVAVASDGSSMSTEGVLSAGKPHPRSYGTNPRFIQKFVNEKNKINYRDLLDKNREISPLIPSDDAVIVFNDHINLKETVKLIKDIVLN